MSARLRQRRRRLCNRSINTPVKGVPTSCFCCREFIRTVVGTLPLSTNFLIEPKEESLRQILSDIAKEEEKHRKGIKH